MLNIIKIEAYYKNPLDQAIYYELDELLIMKPNRLIADVWKCTLFLKL